MKNQRLKARRDALISIRNNLDKVTTDAIGTEFFFSLHNIFIDVKEAYEKTIEELKSKE